MSTHHRVGSTSSAELDTAPLWDGIRRPGDLVKEYLLEHVPEYRYVAELRQQGWDSKAADRFFEKQRHAADTADDRIARFFYKMMKEIGSEMNRETGALRVLKRGSKAEILDLCAAPGGFLETTMRLNAGAKATAFTLPPSEGGHEVLMPWKGRTSLTFNFADVTMLAGDMGCTEIPAEHPDAERFVTERQIDPEQRFDLALCDGQVLRTHARASYREWCEARRLICTQLAIGLEHLAPGGSMVVLLHKVEGWETVCLLYTFSRFSSIRLFKPKRAHAKRSSFYMTATNVQSQGAEAKAAVERWKLHWRVATFGSQEEWRGVFSELHVDEEQLLEEFGPDLVRLGRGIWEIQAKALENAPYMKNKARLEASMTQKGQLEGGHETAPEPRTSCDEE